MATLHQYSDPVKFRAFLATLTDAAQDWFLQIEPGSITNFGVLGSRFLNHFASVKAHEKTYLALSGVHQREGETLREFVARYTRLVLEVPSATEQSKVGGLTRGYNLLCSEPSSLRNRRGPTTNC